jgi:hypothetical protein
MPIKTFRGLIADNTSDTIVLHTNNGSIGYRIKKFELFATTPGVIDVGHIVQVFTIPKTDTTLYDDVDFSDQTLLAAAYYKDDEGGAGYSDLYAQNIIFDNQTFNQDIYVTHADVKGSRGVNYYIELEQVRLDLNENTVATLKDIRNNA